jgi:hypothetical protein
MPPRCEGRIHSALFRRERCCREAAWSNVTYVPGALMNNGTRSGPLLKGDGLEAGPGRGPCSITRGFMRRLGRRVKTQNHQSLQGPRTIRASFI